MNTTMAIINQVLLLEVSNEGGGQGAEYNHAKHYNCVIHKECSKGSIVEVIGRLTVKCFQASKINMLFGNS